MRVGDRWRKLVSDDLAVLVLLAATEVLLHTVTNGQYGYHRDELAPLDDGRFLAWGYVAYPPVTEFLKSIHARDIRMGRSDTFVFDQFWTAFR